MLTHNSTTTASDPNQPRNPAPKLGSLMRPYVRVAMSYKPAFKTIFKAALKKKKKKKKGSF
jgi:hypothetical protein